MNDTIFFFTFTFKDAKNLSFFLTQDTARYVTPPIAPPLTLCVSPREVLIDYVHFGPTVLSVDHGQLVFS